MVRIASKPSANNMAPGIPLEVVISFDRRGSMSRWLNGIRHKVEYMITRLQADIPGIRIAVFAHGDYSDVETYVTKFVDLTTDVFEICDFVHKVKRTFGGDAPECYELVMRQVRSEISWSVNSRKVLILIGDDVPHSPKAACNKEKINWKQETKLFAEAGISIYGVQCGIHKYADSFYKTISESTQGKHLKLTEFSSLFDTLMAVCYRVSNGDATLLSKYEKEVRARCNAGRKITPEINAIFALLKNNKGAGASPSRSLLARQRQHQLFRYTAHKAKPRTSFTTKGTRKTMKKVKPDCGENTFLLNNSPLLRRENVPEKNFVLRKMKWSPRTLAIANFTDIPRGQTKKFVSRVSRPGYRLKTLTAPVSVQNAKIRPSAFFELAVRGPGFNAKRHVVFSTFSNRCFGTRRWAQRLLRKVNPQVDRVLKSGCRIDFRFCIIKQSSRTTTSNNTSASRAVRDVRSRLQRYDYAWRRMKNVRGGARQVQRGKVLISQ